MSARDEAIEIIRQAPFKAYNIHYLDEWRVDALIAAGWRSPDEVAAEIEAAVSAYAAEVLAVAEAARRRA